MHKVRLICRKCGLKFTAEVLDEDEAEDRRRRSSPVRCPHCNSTEIERC